MRTIFLGLGTNSGDLTKNITQAIELIGSFVSDISRAQLYTSKAMYYSDQPNFINTVVKGQTKISPTELLKKLKDIEKTIGRKKTFRNGPRMIDLDILFYDDLILETSDLQIPHKLLYERDFVLQPICDIAPDFIHPKLHKTMKELLDSIPSKSKSIVNFDERTS